MSSTSLNPPLLARVGGILRVVLICRISTEHQDARSLADQQALLEDWLQKNYSGKTNVKVVAGRGSGELINRPETQELYRLIEANAVDLVLAEDLGRIYRRVHSILVCEDCLDRGIRVIALNDHLDTFLADWKLSGMFAALRHEQYNADTALRIRRSLRNRFSNGGVVQRVPYGYEKLPGAKSENDVRKLPEAEAVYDRWFEMLEQGAGYSGVADYLNEIGIPAPNYRNSRTRSWDCAAVRRTTHNKLLKGLRQRNNKISVRDNGTGEHKTDVAPVGDLLERFVPHLVFIDPERYDRVITLLRLRNAQYRRKGIDGVDTRKGVSRKRTRWPGQHVFCGICGKMFVFGAHGQVDHLMCRGAREYKCWQSSSINATLSRRKLLDAIWREIESLPEFASEMLAELKAAALEQNQSLDRDLESLKRREIEHGRFVSNIQHAIREYGPSDVIASELSRLQEEEDELKLRKHELDRQRITQVRVPSLAEIKADVRSVLDQVAADSQEAARILRHMIPQIVVSPFRLRNRGLMVLRAKLTLNLAAAWPDRLPAAESLIRELEVDLFDPPQRERFRKEVVRLKALGMKEREIAKMLGITQPAVQNAMKLQREIYRLGVSDAYIQVTEPPQNTKRHVRHLHPRFKQAPREENESQ